MTKNDDAWEKLFEKHNILNEIEKKGRFEISASQIKEVREPRLMVKFDYENQLPKIFSENKLAILPINRGKYVISKFKAYHKLDEKSKKIINEFPFPECIQSIDFNNITSETQALNCAYISGIIADFLEDKKIYPTVEGRMSSGKFDFNILDMSESGTIDVSIDNSQIEIDGAYEGLDFLALIEAKTEYPENFLVRQLYYPFRTWKNCVDKEVKTIFLVYSNGIFSLYEYAFNDESCYNSLKLIKQANYSIFEEIEMGDIQFVIDSVKIVSEPEISFPQADNFERIISLCESLKEKKLTKDEITEKYSFNMRQSDYYATAGMYLGLIDKTCVYCRNPTYCLTKRGERIFNLPLKQRQLELVKCILEHDVFLSILKLWFDKSAPPSVDDRVNIMKQKGIYNVKKEGVFVRRSRTVLRWLEWILKLKNE